MAPLSKGAWAGLPPELVQLAASKADDESRCALPSRGALEGMVQLERRARTCQRGRERPAAAAAAAWRRLFDGTQPEELPEALSEAALTLPHLPAPC